MFKSARMQKVAIYGTKNNSRAVITDLYSLGALHIIEHDKTADLDIGKPLDDSYLCSSALVKLRSITNFLKINTKEIQIKKTHGAIKSRIKIIEGLHHKVIETNNRINSINSELAKLKSELVTANSIKAIDADTKLLQGMRSVSCFFGTVKNADIEKQLDEVTDRYELKRLDKTILLYVDRSKADEVAVQLAKLGYTELSTKEASNHATAESYLKSLAISEKNLSRELETIKKDLDKLKRDHEYFLAESEMILSEEFEQTQAPLKFAETKYAYMITGYIPNEKYEEVVRTLIKRNVFVQKRDIEKEESVPIKLKNPKISSPFEFLMDLYTLPNYKEIDPTTIMFFTFPFLFGFMIGDFGYGITSLIIFLVLRKYIKSGRKLFDVMIAASVMAILFGFLFGEFFGFEKVLGMHLPSILIRSEMANLNTLLMISLAIGVVHLNLGLLIGVYNETKHHGFWHAFCTKISWMILQVGAALIYFKMLYLGLGLIALAAVLLVIGEGIRGIIELPSIFGNIFSYARLMAIAVAGVMLAVIINRFAEEFMASGTIGGIIAAVFLLVFGHAINLALALLGSFLHSLRLHYVEFFSKFYTGGGKEYRPFGGKKW